MRRKWKKLLSTTLALAMVITTIGVREVPVSAAEEENTNESVVYMDNMAYDTTTGHFYKLSSVGTYEQVNAEAKESGGYLACILECFDGSRSTRCKGFKYRNNNCIILYWTYKKCREPSGMVVGRWKRSKLH